MILDFIIFRFQSTLPVRGATFIGLSVSHFSNISIHAPREGSDGAAAADVKVGDISIHAPREGSDLVMGIAIVAVIYFNPRSP